MGSAEGSRREVLKGAGFSCHRREQEGLIRETKMDSGSVEDPTGLETRMF